MAHIKRKYIDSHWLVFAVQGALALALGWIVLFSPSVNLAYLMSIVGVFLLGLGMVELFNCLHRSRIGRGWTTSLVLAIIDVVVAMVMLLTLNEPAIFHLSVLSAYTLARGFFELLIGLRSADDLTDRFIWVITGICGVVMGIVIFNSSAIHFTEFIRFFGAYMMILGIASLIYAVHNHEEKLEDHRDRSAAARKGHAKTRKNSQQRRK